MSECLKGKGRVKDLRCACCLAGEQIRLLQGQGVEKEIVLTYDGSLVGSLVNCVELAMTRE